MSATSTSSEPAGGERTDYDLIVVGGGAAGFFGAITAAERGLRDILICEQSREVLTKVRISGGGRCNVTHACFDARELVGHYPRGHRSLRGTFHRWRVADTIDWFQSRGVRLKTESDGRMFPESDRSQSIIDALTNAARRLEIPWETRCRVERVEILPGPVFAVHTSARGLVRGRRLLVAVGGLRGRQAGDLIEDLGQRIHSPVPSLFSFHVDDPRLVGLAGVAAPDATVSALGHRGSGPVLVTHRGLSGPAILKLSAWGARDFAGRDYRFSLRIDWTGGEPPEAVGERLRREKLGHGARRVGKRSLFPGISQRLWAALVTAAGISEEMTWARLPKLRMRALVDQLTAGEFTVAGKSLNKDEFVTCGGVPLEEVDLKTMCSKHQPGLYFAGEVLDLDGVTGGFNFQGAWATGRLAGEAIAAEIR